MNDGRPLLHLASASPRRAQILAALGLAFTASGAEVNEQRGDGEAADAMVLRLASAKAGAARLTHTEPVLAADTAVVIDAPTWLGSSQPEDFEGLGPIPIRGRRFPIDAFALRLESSTPPEPAEASTHKEQP